MAKLRISKNKKTKAKFNRRASGKGTASKKPQIKKGSKKVLKPRSKEDIKKKQHQGDKEKEDIKRKRESDNGEVESVESKKLKLSDSSVECNLTRKEREKKKLAKRKEQKVSIESLEKIKTAKEIWEHIRRHDMQRTERDKLIDKIMSLVKSHIHELSLKHDTARIIQCILKFGSESIKNEVFDKLNELSKLKYAKFVVKALFRYCTPEQRSILITKFYNHVPVLVRHKEAVELVELAYNDYANAQERALLLQEFYGPKFALFKDTGGQCLTDILSAHPEQKEQLITHMKKALIPLVDKNLVKHNIVHSALLEFMLHADESSKAEMIEVLRDVAVEMLHTREGAKVNLQCIWHGSAKDRKIYVKSLKGYVVKICKEEHGHLVLLGIFDSVDDTVLVTKHIINEMTSSLEELCHNKHARRVILYLLSPRSPKYFSNQFLQLLIPGDSNANSKKPQVTRWSELCTALSPSLVSLLSDKAVEWICQKPLAPLVIQTVECCTGDVSPILFSLCQSLSAPFENEEEHIVGDPCGHWVLKRLISIKRDNDTPLFAEMILKSLSEESLQSWSTTNRGCFVLVSLMSSCESIKTKLIGILNKLVDQLRTSDREGVKVLLKIIIEE